MTTTACVFVAQLLANFSVYWCRDAELKLLVGSVFWWTRPQCGFRQIFVPTFVCSAGIRTRTSYACREFVFSLLCRRAFFHDVVLVHDMANEKGKKEGREGKFVRSTFLRQFIVDLSLWQYFEPVAVHFAKRHVNRHDGTKVLHS